MAIRPFEEWQKSFVQFIGAWPLYDQIDEMRRALGASLDAARIGVRESVYRVVLRDNGFALRCYSPADSIGPALLLVPAPIKAPYIWDVLPRASVVQQCVEAGFQVFVVEWRPPEIKQEHFGLAEYADRFLGECLQVMSAEKGKQRAFVAGHSLGGTFAAIFAALYPERLEGLILLGAPLNFGADIGAFGPVVAATPPAEDLIALPGNIPGSLLNSISLMASPPTFAWSRGMDLLTCLLDSEALETHVAVERWTLDERALARRLFEEVWEDLFRHNRFMQGTLVVAGKRAGPDLVLSPMLAVIDRSCQIVPPEAVLPFVDAACSTEKRLLWYEGDSGVSLQHIGMLVGRNAHQRLWPEIFRWMHAQAT